MSASSNSITQLKENLRNMKSELKTVWPIILEDITTDPKFRDVPGCVERVNKLLVNNVPCGKHARALLHINMYHCLNPRRTERENFLTNICGWLIEIGQTCALIVDDIMDHSETRRGMLCWYKRPEIGVSRAIEDLQLVSCITSNIAIKYFRDFDYVLQLMEVSSYDSMRTTIGEGIDVRLTHGMSIDFSRFTEEMYKKLVEYKTSRYTFYSPIATAMIRSGIKDQTLYDVVESVCIAIGELFQIQDDFLDCYGDPDITGKIGTDIQDGKLTWLIAKALKLASESQRKILEENYGQGINIIAETKVKDVYDELGIQEIFYKHEHHQRLMILEQIYSLPEQIPKNPFITALSLIYKREK